MSSFHGFKDRGRVQSDNDEEEVNASDRGLHEMENGSQPFLNETAMLRFTLFKIPVSIHWMFWLLAGFLGGMLRAQTATDWHKVLVFVAAVFVSILIHELGHALTGIKFGARNVQIQLHGMGGLARFGNESMTRGQKIAMTAAGPGASILLAIVFFAIAVVTYDEPSTSSYPQFLLSYFFNVMFTINIFWSIVNLFPVLPLDGGQILRDILGPDKIKLTCIISFVTLAVLTALLWTATRSLFNLLIMVFLGSYTWNLYQQVSKQQGT